MRIETGRGPHPDYVRFDTHYGFGPDFREASDPGSWTVLYLASQFVERHGGRLRAESDEGKGSRFYVTLPWIGGGVGYTQTASRSRVR